MNRIDTLFQTGRKAFIAYVTAGYPSVDATLGILNTLVANGADLIELGFPFSDPTADGPVIQASSQAALDAGMKRHHYFEIVKHFRAAHPTVPVVVFTYYNPVFRMGQAAFAQAAHEAGADALLVVDLPFEEQGELLPALDRYGMHLIQLIAPTTPPERARTVLAKARGFVYQISVKGVTGMREGIGTEAARLSAQTKTFTKVPVCLGFGVSRGEQAKAIAAVADGVIVGSAIVKTIADNLPDYTAPLAALTRELADAVHGVN